MSKDLDSNFASYVFLFSSISKTNKIYEEMGKGLLLQIAGYIIKGWEAHGKYIEAGENGSWTQKQMPFHIYTTQAINISFVLLLDLNSRRKIKALSS